jgi:hypothetical protein
MQRGANTPPQRPSTAAPRDDLGTPANTSDSTSTTTATESARLAPDFLLCTLAPHELGRVVEAMDGALWARFRLLVDGSIAKTVFGSTRQFIERSGSSIVSRWQRPHMTPSMGRRTAPVSTSRGALVFETIVLGTIADSVGARRPVSALVDVLRFVVSNAELVRSVPAVSIADLKNPNVAPGSCLSWRGDGEVRYALDPDGVAVLAERARSPVVGANTKTGTCERVRALGSLTCSPEGIVTADAARALFVPVDMADRFRALALATHDKRREEQIHRVFQPQGVNVSTIICTGTCGGFPSDRRKKKKQQNVPDDDDAATSAATPSTSSTKTTESRTAVDAPVKASPWATRPKACSVTTTAAVDSGAGKTGCGGIARMIETCMPGEFEEMADGMDVPAMASSEAQTKSPGYLCRGESSWIPDDAEDADLAVGPWWHDRPSARQPSTKQWTCRAGREERALVAIAEEIRNLWSDLAWTPRFGGAWSHPPLPCGCACELIRDAVAASRKSIAIHECQRESDTGQVQTPLWPVVAFAVDAMCGTFTRGVAEAPCFAEFVRANTSVLTTLASTIHGDLQRAGDAQRAQHAAAQRERERGGSEQPPASTTAGGCAAHSSADQSAAWGCAVSAARAAISRRSQTASGVRQPWYFAPATRVTTVRDAIGTAASRGMFSRAEEIAAACAMHPHEAPVSSFASGQRRERHRQQQQRSIATERRRSTSSPTGYPRQQQQQQQQQIQRKRAASSGVSDETRPSVALAFDDRGTAWSCDVAWTARLATDAFGSSYPAACGHAVPVTDRCSVVALGGDIASDETDGDCDPACRCGSDPSDAFVAGAMCGVLGAVRGCHGTASYVADCCLVYPFVYLVLAHGDAAREREARHWAQVSKRTTVDVDDGWDTLIRAAAAWLADTAGAASAAVSAVVDPAFPREARRDEVVVCLTIMRILALALGPDGTTQHSPSVDNINQRTFSPADFGDGISCALRPRAAWSLSSTSAATIATTSKASTTISVLGAIAAAARRTDGGLFGGADADAVTRTRLNVGLVIACSARREAAVALLTGLRPAAAGVPAPQQQQQQQQQPLPQLQAPRYPGGLAGFDPMAGYLSCITELGVSSSERGGTGSAGTGCQHRRPVVGKKTVPCLRVLCEEYVRDASSSSAPSSTSATEAVLRFLRTAEEARRRNALRGQPDQRADPQPAAVGPLTARLREACSRAWQRRAVPLCEASCTGAYLTSSDVVPIADSPFCLPDANLVECHACGARGPSRRGDIIHPALNCLPPKHGPLMAELTHARNGMVVLPHAMPSAGPRTAPGCPPTQRPAFAPDAALSAPSSTSISVSTTPAPTASSLVAKDYQVNVVRSVASVLRSGSSGGVANERPSIFDGFGPKTVVERVAASHRDTSYDTCSYAGEAQRTRSGTPAWLAELGGDDIMQSFGDLVKCRSEGIVSPRTTPDAIVVREPDTEHSMSEDTQRSSSDTGAAPSTPSGRPHPNDAPGHGLRGDPPTADPE